MNRALRLIGYFLIFAAYGMFAAWFMWHVGRYTGTW